MAISGAIRWGIVATGGIAAKFAEACAFESRRTGKSLLCAVASRDAEKARVFADRRSIPRSYGSYAELFADPEIDAVYIATPHDSHAALSIAALESGKAVLCEKPVSLTAGEFRPVVETARRRDLFFMEAMWMRFNPSFQKALSWVSSGAIGTPRFIRADFFLDTPFNPESRLYNPERGGGAILDLGIYPVTFATAMAGNRPPARVSATVDRAENGVDVYDKAQLRWSRPASEGAPDLSNAQGGELIADLSCALGLQGLRETRSAFVIGTRGAVILPYFWMAEEAHLVDSTGRELEVFRAPFDCNGYEYEIREVESRLFLNQTESPVQTWANSIMVMDILDQIRTVANDE